LALTLVGAGLLLAGAADVAPALPRGGALSPFNAPSSSPGPGPSLAEAERLVFANRYDDAERTYRAVLQSSPHDPLARAAHALFLSYRHEFGPALAEARQAVELGPRSGRAQAVLCRVQDWGDRVPEALAAGRRAIELEPEDPLGHLFLGEALGDGGDDAAAAREIAAAAALVGPQSSAYVRAEVHREEGNLARGQGNHSRALGAFQSAYQAQPQWVERLNELAGAFIDIDNLDGAREVLDRALALVPDDRSLLSQLGALSIQRGDYAAADRAYGALLRLAPDEPGVRLMNAQVAMAAHHDSGRARELLRQAVERDPGDSDAAAYLLFLDRNVEQDDALATRELAQAVAASADDVRPNRRVAPPHPDALLAAAARAALAAVNDARARAGLGPVRLDDRLSASAVAHCFYWLFNNAAPQVAGLGIHAETLGSAGFSGVGPADRARAQGYRGGVGEDITHRGSPILAVADWIDSVYHRFPLLRPDLRAIGFGSAGAGPLVIDDMEFGFAPQDAGHDLPVLYPAAGQTDVPTSFFDNELPDPVPPGGPRTTGYPVTVTFAPFDHVRLQAFRLRGPGGTELPAYLLPPSADTENSASLLPQQPLRAGTAYTVEITATIGDQPWSRTWVFTTAAPPRR
jgi:tetratricopeptide (TPR) repeat protein